MAINIKEAGGDMAMKYLWTILAVGIFALAITCTKTTEAQTYRQNPVRIMWGSNIPHITKMCIDGTQYLIVKSPGSNGIDMEPMLSPETGLPRACK